MSRELVVVGAGGHAKVVISAARAAGFTIAAVLDDNQERWGQELLGAPVRGAVAELEAWRELPAVLAIGSNRVRHCLSLTYPDREWATVIHPRACVDATVTVRPGSVVMAGVVVQPDSVIGGHVILNTSATVDHDCEIGDCAHLAPGSHLAGDVRIGKGAFLGTGSAVIPGRTVGEWAIVGAGGVVVTPVPDGVTAVGVPARWKQR